METHRHKTLKKTDAATATATAATAASSMEESPPSVASLLATLQDSRSIADERFKNLLDAGTREAYARPWHRIERGLRLNRLRIFIEEVAPQYEMTKEEKDDLFLFLQKALDKKQLNTLKVVQYDLDKQRIVSIKGLELKRTTDGVLKGSFGPIVKLKSDSTRKKRKADVPSVSTILVQTAHKIDEADEKE